MTLAIADEETRNEIVRMADKVYERFKVLEDRVSNVEVQQKIHSWLLTLDTFEYDEKYPPHFRLLFIVKSFYELKDKDWNILEIQYLKKALKEVELSWKQKITFSIFIDELIDEIEENSYQQFHNIIFQKYFNNYNVNPEEFILENIAVPSFNSLFQISKDYSKSSQVIDVLIEQLNISKKVAVKQVLTTFIKKLGVDLEVSIPLGDFAIELLSCMKLTKSLLGNGFVNEPKINDQKKEKSSIRVKEDLKKSKECEEEKDDKNQDKDFKGYLKKAENGDPEAQYKIGEMYDEGQEVKEDKEKAFKWYMKSAEQGFAEAQYWIGISYDLGICGVNENKIEALNWFDKVANNDNESVILRLANHFIYEEKNKNKAKEYLEKLIKLGNLSAMALYAFFVNNEYTHGFLYVNEVKMDGDKLFNASKSYAGNLTEDVLILWDSTLWGKADQGFLITEDLKIVSNKDKYPISLKDNPKKVLNSMNIYLTDSKKSAILKLVELVKTAQ